MKVTSDYKFTDITDLVNKDYHAHYIPDSHVLIAEKGFTEHLLCTETRYSSVFWFYKTDSIIGQSLYHYGEYTQFELNLLDNFITPDSVIYDIGANIGVHTVAFAEKGKHVYAFEPNKLNYKLLKLNTIDYDNVSLYETAISKDAGITHIEEFSLTNIGNYGECRIVDDGQECTKISIDELVRAKELQPPSLIKIDVEGHEWEVFQGMSETVKTHMPIVFYEALHCDLASIYDMLHGLQYKLFWFPCANYNPQNYRNNRLNIFGNGGVINILAVPPTMTIKTTLPEVISNTDTFMDAVNRMPNAQRN